MRLQQARWSHGMASGRGASRADTTDEAIARWESVAREHAAKQSVNPFSDWEGSSRRVVRYDRTDARYGRPPEGSSTERRGLAAKEHVDGEIVQLCDVIRTIGAPDDGGRYAATFGQLFEAYTKISNKVVGILLRARRKGCVAFAGEMLYQGRDEGAIIRLLADCGLPSAADDRQRAAPPT